jgi:recombination protein RecR
MRLPKTMINLIEHFERLPGIGPKTAQRLTFYLLRIPEEDIGNFSDALRKLKSETKICSICKNVGETDPCEICTDDARDKSLIAVVSSPMDALALERAGFKGNYHVLHGLIDPLNNIGPDEIFIDALVKRINDRFISDKNSIEFEDYVRGVDRVEIIMATNTSMEGESTAMYITKLIRDSGFNENKIYITRLARGLPVGGDVEYADNTTLMRALEGRSDFK